ncbi:pentatricopeptide repeat-containing protein At1g61870, mitochondrial-like [Andrographis paniculata]|uniref:pentatricopeptide repeat-containing protein At1g61870, mitochondrial-like n=1 Tax=Andrographis paniculata TaxID=175694 RepID=UPI0021E77A28|nr:pentatricopeptide repeat-containing protein At1g61870, mitochondrial-like [Andrographis paniculata]
MAMPCGKLRSVILQWRRLSTVTGGGGSRSLLPLILGEQNPERILDICRSATLSPESFHDRLAYSKAISKLRDANHYDGIRCFIKESMDKLHNRSERAASHFIILYAQGGLIDDAIKLFDEMPEKGIERNVKTLNSLLYSCTLAGEYGVMKRIFLEFPMKYDLRPNLDTYNVVLRGFCQSGSASEAHAMLAEMETKGITPDTKTFTTVIAGFYMEEKFSEVGMILALMKKYGIVPNISIYNVRIQSLCKLKRSDEAKALFDGILARGMKPNQTTYRHLVYGFCRERKLGMAKSLFKEMIDKGMEPGSECYFTLAYYLCQGRDFEEASSVCKDCMSKGFVPNITTMKSLVYGLVGIGKVREAREIISQVKGKFSKNSSMWSEIEEGLD